MNLRFLLAAMVCILGMAPQLSAQSFLRINNTGPVGCSFFDVDIMLNGNYVCTGVRSFSSSPNVQKVFTVIYSPTGQVLKQIDSHGTNDQGNAVVATSDGGFAVVGHLNTLGSQNPESFYFIRYNSSGDSLWRKVYTSRTIPLIAYDICQLSDSGFVVVGSASPTATSDKDYLVIRTNANGDTLWTHQGVSTQHETGKCVIPTQDGGFLVAGITNIQGSFATNGFVCKLDANGNRLWYHALQNFDPSVRIAAAETPSGNFLLMAKPNGGQVPRIFTLNAQGDSIDVYIHTQPQNTLRIFDDMHLNPDGTIAVTGLRYVSGAPFFWLMKLDSQFDTIWSRTYGSEIISGRGKGIKQTADGGYIVAGGWGNFQGSLLKTDSLGNVEHSLIEGRLVKDDNANCTFDSGEVLATNQIVKITTAALGNYYGYSNTQGSYRIEVYDTGQAQIEWLRPNNLWDTIVCLPNTQPVNLQLHDTVTMDLFKTPLTQCPVLNVNINNTGLRRCFSNNIYYINYCNEGTDIAYNAYIDVTFDQYLQIDNSSMPWQTPQTGNTYRFEVGSLAVGECGNIQVSVTVNCDSTLLGQTHCVEAHIYPDSICEPVEPSWDLSSLFLQAQCIEGDSIRFILTNQGTGNMAGPSSYSIVENLTVINQVSFQLNAGESLTVTLPGNGSTYTMIVPQSAGHPGNSAPLRVVEGCGKNNQGNFSIGFTMQFPQDDQDEFVDIHCQPNRGSFDPNDKRPEPLGLGAQGAINTTQPLDYTIRFQNTGTDTAFLVVIRDTLSPYLDISTLRLTGASHNYTFQIIGNNILEWTFPNILLPDSNVNEPLSNGFVSFGIKQVEGNVPQTEITNRAGIYFDFNLPVITNTTLNTVVEDYKALFTYLFIPSVEDKLQLGIYPNPNNGTFSLDFAAKAGATYEFVMYDLAGAKQFEQALIGNGPHTLQPVLPTGMYLYQLLENSKVVATGKVVVGR